MREVDTIPSRVEQVTVFASGARVRRSATLRAPLPERVRIGDLPLAVIDDTVRAEVAGGAVATAVRTGLAAAGGVASEESPELRAARTREELAKSEVQRLELSIDRLTHAKIVMEDPSDEAPAAWNAVMTARRALVAARAERHLVLKQQVVAARRELEEASRALGVARERDAAASSARDAKLHEQRKHVELDLTFPAGTGDITIHIEYQVAAARWAPSYVARLDADGTRFELRAVVAQSTGEDWTGVALKLSTAEPDQFAPLPELHPQKIGRRQAEPSKRGFRAPPAGAEALYADYLAKFPTPTGSTKTGGIAPTKIMTTPSDPFAPPSGEVWDEGSSRSKDAYPEQQQRQSIATCPACNRLNSNGSDFCDFCGTPMAAPRGGKRGAKMDAPPPPPSPAAMPMMAPGAMPVTRSAPKGGGIAGAVVGGIAGAVAAPFALAAQGVARMRAADHEGGGGGYQQHRQEEANASATPRLDYGNLRMGAVDSTQRGKLVPAPRVTDAGAGKVADALGVLTRLPLPPGHSADWAHTYDYAFASDGVVDVKSDGNWHNLALTSRAGSSKLRHVAVPREQDDVFRVAAITNPFDGPLLPGPIDVYDRGQFLVTSPVDYTPPGGTVDIGLGVDAAVKIARNAEFHEETAGMLRGALKLFHAVTVEVENLSGRAIDLEVRERVPVAREGDDDIKVKLGKIEPSWERWIPDPEAPAHARPRGTYRWRVDVAPRTKKQLRAAYEVEIASKNELVGGNRREP